MKKLLSMKKLIFIATMFLISVSANSQIQDVRKVNTNLFVTNSKGKEICQGAVQGELMGWTNTYVVCEYFDNNKGNGWVTVHNSEGRIIKWIYNVGVTSVTPNYFIIRTNEGDKKYNNKGEQIW